MTASVKTYLGLIKRRSQSVLIKEADNLIRKVDARPERFRAKPPEDWFQSANLALRTLLFRRLRDFMFD
jgi:hypothetical protein